MKKLHSEELILLSGGYCNPVIEDATGECISIQCMVGQIIIDTYNFVSPYDIYWRPYCYF
jgi:hypothetical protein